MKVLLLSLRFSIHFKDKNTFQTDCRSSLYLFMDLNSYFPSQKEIVLLHPLHTGGVSFLCIFKINMLHISMHSIYICLLIVLCVLKIHVNAIVSSTLVYSFDGVFLEFMNVELYRKNTLTVIYSIFCMNTYNLPIHSTVTGQFHRLQLFFITLIL